MTKVMCQSIFTRIISRLFHCHCWGILLVVVVVVVVVDVVVFVVVVDVIVVVFIACARA